MNESVLTDVTYNENAAAAPVNKILHNESISSSPIVDSSLAFFLKEIGQRILNNDIFKIDFDFKDRSFILFFGEDEVPILIREEKVYSKDLNNFITMIAAELYTELLTHNLSSYEISKLNQIVSYIESNQKIISTLFS